MGVAEEASGVDAHFPRCAPLQRWHVSTLGAGDTAEVRALKAKVLQWTLTATVVSLVAVVCQALRSGTPVPTQPLEWAFWLPLCTCGSSLAYMTATGVCDDRLVGFAWCGVLSGFLFLASPLSCVVSEALVMSRKHRKGRH
eukprot:Rhum_TRINITY_DN12197_c0_g1::Rhum_TRINITY_DN12197_c0_g1_i1::g.49983::m.49983